MKLSVIILAKDVEEIIRDCLESAKWADEIILVDTGSIDKTIEIAKKYQARILKFSGERLEFSKWRNRGLEEAKSDWVFYLDADERVTPELKNEILQVISDQRPAARTKPTGHRSPVTGHQTTAYAIPRRNFYFGKEVHFGGAWPDYVKRLFKKEKLKRWEGRLHEEPIFEGKLGHLKEPMTHFTHRNLSSMVEKTRKWSKIEAELLFEAKHPPAAWWRILRIMLTEFWKRAIRLQGWRDGTVGWIEIIFQMFSRFITYARLWELQNRNRDND